MMWNIESMSGSKKPYSLIRECANGLLRTGTKSKHIRPLCLYESWQLCAFAHRKRGNTDWQYFHSEILAIFESGPYYWVWLTDWLNRFTSTMVTMVNGECALLKHAMYLRTSSLREWPRTFSIILSCMHLKPDSSYCLKEKRAVNIFPFWNMG